jgi:predicted dinucleotide-binding enzyme
MNVAKATAVSHFLFRVMAAATMFAIAAAPAAQDTPPDIEGAMRIGIIGSGNIGGTIGELWARAGHQVFFSSRHPENLKALVEKAGPRARAGTVAEAIAFGDVILLAVPYAAMPQISRDHAKALAGKPVLDAGNPIPRRDGDMAGPALEKSAGVATAEYLPGARIVRAFNCTSWRAFASEAHRDGEKLGVPLAGDDDDALELAARLVTDVGFDPVIAGPLERGRAFDFGSPLFGTAMTARELRAALGLDPL